MNPYDDRMNETIEADKFSRKLKIKLFRFFNILGAKQ